MIIIDYPSIFGNSYQLYDKEKADKITEVGREYLRRNIESFILDYYKIDKLVLDKFIEIYGKNPSGSMFDYPDSNDINIERDRQRLIDITRALKIKKIKDNYFI